MAYKIFVFVGIILLGTGILLYFVLGQSGTAIVVNGVRDNSSSTRAIVQYSVSGFMGGLGLLFIVGAMRSHSRVKKQQAQNMHILQTGIQTEAKVLFVDKNYSFLVNKKPIYSIVEYTYQDQTGQQHTRRVETIPSDMVIRTQIQVGSMIPIKYATENYGQSVMLL